VNIAISSQVLVSRSRDGGDTWSVSQVGAEPPHSYAMDYNPSITVGEDGTIYLAWMHCPNGPLGDCSPNSIEDVAFSKSSDGGETWSKPTLIAQVAEVPNPNGCMCYPFGPIPNTNVYAPNTPALGVDNSSGPHSGRLYAVMFDWTGT
jgi:Neuraminidase (sialidase)